MKVIMMGMCLADKLDLFNLFFGEKCKKALANVACFRKVAIDQGPTPVR